MSLWFKRKPKPSLPFNIHDAAFSTPPSSSESSGSGQTTLVARQGRPRFYLAAERLAAREGISVEKWLSNYTQRLRDSAYPTDACLNPDEVQDYVDHGTLSDDQKKHLSACNACKSLLRALCPRRMDIDFPLPVVPVRVPNVASQAPTKNPSLVMGNIAAEATRAAFMDKASLRLKNKQPDPGPLAPVYPGRQPAAGPPALRVSPRNWSKGLAVAAIVCLAALVTFLVYHVRKQNDNIVRIPKSHPVEAATISVAVVPVRNHGRGDLVTNGLAANMIRKMGAVKGLRVTGVNSACSFQDRDVSSLEIARELDVDQVAELSMEHHGDRLFVTANLVKVSENTRQKLWTHYFNFSQKDALLRSDIMARAIVKNTGVVLTPEDRARLVSGAAVSPASSVNYLRGLSLLNTRVPENILQSIDLLEAVVHQDPKFAIGWASLADAYSLAALRPGSMTVQDAYPKAKEAVNTALKLDPNLANAHAALALTYLYNEFKWDESEKEFKRALELNPSYAEAHQWYGLLLSALNRPDEAIPELQRAVELEPLVPNIKLAYGGGYYLGGKPDEAIKIYTEVLEKAKKDNIVSDKKFDIARENLVSAYLQVKRCKEAGELLQLLPEEKNIGDLAYKYAVCDQQDDARNLLPQMKDPFEKAQVFAALGALDEAFASLDEASKQRNRHLFQLAVDPAFKPLKSDPRFKEQLEGIHYPNPI